jgi:hypothetical protein
MKKLLFGTTALLAAGAFTSAQASEPVKLQLGGYMEYYMVGSQQDSDFRSGATNRVNNFDVQGDGEIWFTGLTTLDNGMKVGVRVELEAGNNDNGTDIIDESYIWVEGKYGKLILGSTNDVAYLSRVGAPEASEMGQGINEGDTNKYLIIPAAVNYLDAYIGLDGASGDANKISYFTPSFYGFQGGISYTPSNHASGDDGSSTSETIAKATNIDDAWSFVVKYDNTIAGVGVKAMAAYVTADDRGYVSGALAPTQDTTVQDFGGGLALTYMGWTVGGSAHRLIANAATSSGVAATSALANKDGVTWDAGVQYAEGPYKVSLSYLKSDVAGTRGNAVTTRDNDTVEMWRLGAGYTMGPGVILFGQLAYLDADDEDSTAAAKAQSNSGAYGGVVGLKLLF